MKLRFDGYMYKRKATKARVIQWECSRRTVHDCRLQTWMYVIVYFTSTVEGTYTYRLQNEG